jgi:hypothetical protein
MLLLMAKYMSVIMEIGYLTHFKLMLPPMVKCGGDKIMNGQFLWRGMVVEEHLQYHQFQ